MNPVPNDFAAAATDACRAIGAVLSTVAVEARGIGRTIDRDRKVADCRLAAATESLKEARLAVAIRAPLEAVPLLGSMLVGPARRRLDEARRVRRKRQQKLADLNRKLESASRLESKCLETVGRLEEFALDVAAFRDPPFDMRSRLRTACASVVTMPRSKGRMRVRDLVALAEALVGVMSDWRGHDQTVIQVESRPPQGPFRPAIVKPEVRIYLPIPHSLERQAILNGAHIDKSIRSSSRVFLTSHDDLKPFARMLPLAYRQGGAKLHFPPVPARAARHNVWSMFDRETWDRIRHATYESAGRRCIICGSRGGSSWFASAILGSSGRGGVECHETWSWTVEDHSSGVGLQRMDRLMAVCTDCHMIFHEGFAIETARNRGTGLQDEVARRIHERQQLVNAMDEARLTLLLDQDREAWQATNGIDDWVVDLSHLAGCVAQGAEPVFRVANEARVPPERIGGFAFVTDDGRAFPNRPAEQIFRREMARREDVSQRIPGRRGLSP